MFKEGDKVMLVERSMYYSQAPGVVGTVTRQHERRGWFVVEWHQEIKPGRPKKDNYPKLDLVYATPLHVFLSGVDEEDNA